MFIYLTVYFALTQHTKIFNTMASTMPTPYLISLTPKNHQTITSVYRTKVIHEGSYWPDKGGSAVLKKETNATRDKL